MANQEQLDILKQGVEVWNKWRTENPRVQIFLSGANLSGANLTNALQLHFLSTALMVLKKEKKTLESFS
jgi:hypothetical protein